MLKKTNKYVLEKQSKKPPDKHPKKKSEKFTEEVPTLFDENTTQEGESITQMAIPKKSKMT